MILRLAIQTTKVTEEEPDQDLSDDKLSPEDGNCAVDDDIRVCTNIILD